MTGPNRRLYHEPARDVPIRWSAEVVVCAAAPPLVGQVVSTCPRAARHAGWDAHPPALSLP